jgi:hypothetical protein
MLQLIEKKLSGAIFGLKQNTKNVSDVQYWLNKLESVNPLLVDYYQKKLASALALRKFAQA